MNELLFMLTIIINFSGILLFYKLFKKNGLIGWICISTLIANIEVLKSIDLFGMSLTLGNVVYGTTFLATDIVSEVYGEKESRKAVIIGLLSMITFVVAMQISLLFTPNNIDFAHKSMKILFTLSPRICLASLIVFLISNMLDTKLYHIIKKRYPKKLWLRNNGSTLVSQLVDTILFTTIAFYGIYNNKNLIMLCVTTYIIKIIISLLDTPFLYIARKIK